MSDQRDGMDAGVPGDAAFDGDASSESIKGGQAPGGAEAVPEGSSQPPMDGGVMGAVPENGSIPPSGVGRVNDKNAPYPPEERNH